MFTLRNHIPNRPKHENVTAENKFADVINLEDDSNEALGSTSLKRRLHSPSAISSKRRSTSQDSGSDIVILRENPVQRPNIVQRRIRHDTTSPSPAPGQRIFNRLVKPEIHLSRSTTRVNLDNEALRLQFLTNLSVLTGPPVTLFNDIDHTSPPSNFRFINENVVGQNVEPASREWMAGCTCRKDNGRHIGCEHRSCECVQMSDKDEKGNKHFPYSAAEGHKGCLRGVYLKLRNHIYECNEMCNCENNCKNRVVQHGRQVPLEIFRTRNRGWGLRCPIDLLKGQFVDTYRGEVITNEESNHRGLARARDLNADNYLFGLDKFCEPQTITKTEFRKRFNDRKAWHRQLVQDGEYEVTKNAAGEKMYMNPDYHPPAYDIDSKEMGGPTRFINHSCEPNCAIYTVSYNHADEKLYEVAFFATRDVSAGTELTFDYKDNEDTEIITEAMADRLERENGERPIKCLCGSTECRGYFFHQG